MARVTKKQRAADCMERAQRELGKALSLLGGRVRSRPRDMPYPWDFIARQHLEIAMYRAQVASMALAHGRGGDAVETHVDVGVHSLDRPGSVSEDALDRLGSPISSREHRRD
jgi:hypothetical protein